MKNRMSNATQINDEYKFQENKRRLKIEPEKNLKTLNAA